jgi:putative Mg2+ transporter-C (MgtC) family protein
MSLEAQFIAVFQLLLAALLCFVIGIDRERRNRSAGLRTHMMAGMGACLFTIVSVGVFPNDGSRIASQILPGLGFLGAGVILKEGVDVKGLTTATSLWISAAIGMTVGLGAWFLAICATLIAWVILALLIRVENSLPTKDDEEVEAGQ